MRDAEPGRDPICTVCQRPIAVSADRFRIQDVDYHADCFDRVRQDRRAQGESG
jgi:hypothetical protein